MSGHSKWSQIKHKKGITDKKRSNVFSKLSKLISIAARDGADPAANHKLQTVIERARAANMPKDNIERAIKKANDKDTSELKEIIIQAVGPQSSAFIILAITDNSNRTINEIRHLLGTHDIKMAAEGSLDWMFEKKGVIRLSDPQLNEAKELRLIELGAEDIQHEEDELLLHTSPESLMQAQKDIQEAGFKVVSAELEYISKNNVVLEDEAIKEKITKALEELENYDDVENMFMNIENL